MKTTLAVLAYNHQQMTTECQSSIEDALYMESSGGTELLLLDNGSQSPLISRPGWRTVRLDMNIGGIAGQNECFFRATGDWIVFVSNDVIVPKRNSNFYRMLSPGIGQAAPVILNANGTVQSSGGRINWFGAGLNNKRKRDRVDYIPSICYGMLKSTWEEVGKFDEQFPGAYEDVDMGLRLGRKNLSVRHLVAVFHRGNATLKYKDSVPFRLGRERIAMKRRIGSYP